MGLFAFRSGRIAFPQIPQNLPALLWCYLIFDRQSKHLLRCSLRRRLLALDLNSSLLPAFRYTIRRILISASLHRTVNRHPSASECFQVISQFPRTLTRPSLHSVFNFLLRCLSNRGFASSSCIVCVKIIRGVIPLRLCLAVRFPLAYVASWIPPIPYFRGTFLLPMCVSPLTAQLRCLHLLQKHPGVF